MSRAGRVVYEAEWRDSRGRQVKRRVGPAWVEPAGADGWRRRSGRVPEGYFDEKAAIVEMSRHIDAREEELAAGRGHLRPGRRRLAAPRRARRWHQALDAQELPLHPPAPSTAQVDRWFARLDEQPISKGELLELRWRYVSFERATVTVAASWSGGLTGEALGTSPQAFMHFALISAAFCIDRALGQV